MATTGDFYRVLEVDRSAGQEEIQRAYRRLARRLHPDVNNDAGAEERFKQINEAYEVLSDPAKRARYDRFGDAWRNVPDAHDATAARPTPGGSPFGGRRVYVDTGRGGFDRSGAGFGDVDIGDLLDGMFGGGRAGGFGGSTRVSAAGADTEVELELSVEDAYTGGRRQITVQTPSGVRSFDVSLPAGMIDGHRIRLVGQGAAGLGGGPRGDLYLVVRLAAHPRYHVEGRDIAVELPVSAWEAVLGASVPVDTPAGPVQVQVPAGSSTGRRLRLRGRGMPNRNGAPGDLYAEVKVMVPTDPNPAERELWQRLAATSIYDPRADRTGAPADPR